MSKRKIIKIDEDKCNGCGLCIPNCPEGAIQMIDGKARLISDFFCDGLGACIGHCPQGAITIEEREAEPYDESKVMKNIVKQGKNVIKAHLEHLKEHGEEGGAHSHTSGMPGCPGSRMIDLGKKASGRPKKSSKGVSELRQWPIQIMLVPQHAPYLNGADVLIAADCVPFTYPDFHSDFLRGKVLLVGCPKLDDAGFYKNKIAQMLKNNDIKSVACVHMEVPCCFGLISIVRSAVSESGKDIPLEEVNISIRGERLPI